jgi:hypothetical protein
MLKIGLLSDGVASMPLAPTSPPEIEPPLKSSVSNANKT